MPPVLQQPRGFGRDLPRWGRATIAMVDVLAHPIDDRREVVLLFLGRKPFAFIENDSC